MNRPSHMNQEAVLPRHRIMLGHRCGPKASIWLWHRILLARSASDIGCASRVVYGPGIHAFQESDTVPAMDAARTSETDQTSIRFRHRAQFRGSGICCRYPYGSDIQHGFDTGLARASNTWRMHPYGSGIGQISDIGCLSSSACCPGIHMVPGQDGVSGFGSTSR